MIKSFLSFFFRHFWNQLKIYASKEKHKYSQTSVLSNSQLDIHNVPKNVLLFMAKADNFEVSGVLKSSQNPPFQAFRPLQNSTQKPQLSAFSNLFLAIKPHFFSFFHQKLHRNPGILAPTPHREPEHSISDSVQCKMS